MPDNIPLKTKLFIPQVRQSLVPRPRLTAWIHEGTQHALTLISAPPGFGKTTALAEWAKDEFRPLAWLSLDTADNDPPRFLFYLLHALQSSHIVGKEASVLLESIETIPPRTAMERLIGDLEEFPQQFVLVLDDFHIITAQPIHESIAYLLDHLPPQMHLVISTRSDPPIPMARLRSHGDLTELRVDDLRFTTGEAALFLQGVVGIPLSLQEINALEERTEGWVAGLQLAALSMKGRTDISGFIQAFSGSHRFILDYLVEEVINRQEPFVQQFLIRTSILDRLTGSLCDALLAGTAGQNQEVLPPSSQTILEYLQKANIFLVPLDDERRWFRYHHLFAELLQAQLHQSMPDLLPLLHLRAAAWLDQNGFRIEAVQHTLSAGDNEQAAVLIERYAQEHWSFSDLTFLMLISRLPLAVIQAHPKLGFYYAWMLITQGKLEAAGDLLRQLALHFPNDQADPELQGMRGFTQLLFTYIATLSGETSKIELPDPSVLEIIPEHFLAMRNSADVVYAMLLSYRAEFDQACELLLATVRRDLAAQGTTATPISISLTARLRTLQGRLDEAASLCREFTRVITERGKWRFYLAGDLNIVYAEVLREWNQLEDAEREIREGIQINQTWNSPQGIAVGYIALARLQHSQGNTDEALQTLDTAEHLITGSTLTPDLAGELRALRISFELIRGNLSEAQAWSQLPPAAKTDYRWELDFIELARLQLAQGEYGGAQLLLDQLSQQAEAGGRVLRQVKIDLLYAQALFVQKRIPEALKKLENCLALAEPGKFVRTFVDEGKPAQEILSAYLRADSPPYKAYAKRLLDQFQAPGTPINPTISRSGLIEPLTQRELEVLDLICAGRSNQEIANKLIITLNTVKRHNNSLFGKLGVTNRAQAIIRAYQLGLVSDPHS